MDIRFFCLNCINKYNSYDVYYINSKTKTSKGESITEMSAMSMNHLRKIGRMGNSMGIGIPKEEMKKINLNQGDECEVFADPEQNVIIIKPVQRIPHTIRPEILRALEKTMQRYDEALKNLKDR